VNKPVKKGELGDIIWNCYKHAGHERTVAALDKLKELGFREATRSGCSIGIDDMIIPKEKNEQIDEAQKQIKEVEKQHKKGIITSGERYNKIVDIWTHCTDQIANVMLTTFTNNQGKREYNPVSLMVDSGARGNKQQVRQLARVHSAPSAGYGSCLGTRLHRLESGFRQDSVLKTATARHRAGRKHRSGWRRSAAGHLPLRSP